jgi:fructosamine-3-kinase
VTATSPAARIQAALRREVAAVVPLSGGCVAEVCQATLADGSRVVAKVGRDGDALDVEGWMLARLAGEGWPVPAVRYAAADLLIMDFVASDGRADEATERRAAEQLAALHARPHPYFGLERDTLIAGLPQANPPSERWVPFFVEHRLLAMARLAREAGRLSRELHARIEILAAKLDTLLPEPPHPSLIHGDLWGGNLLLRNGAIAALVDPACYCADSEVELAFTTLFHTFGDAFYERYGELRPIPEGFFEERRDLYNLYPLLVHLRLFGAAYASPIEGTLRRFGC